MINYYEVLQINNKADQAIIRAAYRALMKELCNHPDHGGDVREAQKINEAYENLIDPQKRKLFDQRLRRWTGVQEDNSGYHFVIRCADCSTLNRVDLEMLDKIKNIRCGKCGESLKIAKADSDSHETNNDRHVMNLVRNLEGNNWRVVNSGGNYDYKIKSDFFLKNYIYVKKVGKITPNNIEEILESFKSTFSRHLTPVGHYFVLVADNIEYISYIIETIKRYSEQMSGWSYGIIIPVDLSRKQVFMSHVNLNRHPADIIKLRSYLFN